MHAERHQRFARTGRGIQNHMVAGQEVHNGLFLMRPRLDALDVFHPAEEPFVDVVGRKIPFASVAVPFGGQPPQEFVFLLVSHNAQST